MADKVKNNLGSIGYVEYIFRSGCSLRDVQDSFLGARFLLDDRLRRHRHSHGFAMAKGSTARST